MVMTSSGVKKRRARSEVGFFVFLVLGLNVNLPSFLYVRAPTVDYIKKIRVYLK